MNAMPTTFILRRLFITATIIGFVWLQLIPQATAQESCPVCQANGIGCTGNPISQQPPTGNCNDVCDPDCANYDYCACVHDDDPSCRNCTNDPLSCCDDVCDPNCLNYDPSNSGCDCSDVCDPNCSNYDLCTCVNNDDPSFRNCTTDPSGPGCCSDECNPRCSNYNPGAPACCGDECDPACEIYNPCDCGDPDPSCDPCLTDPCQYGCPYDPISGCF